MHEDVTSATRIDRGSASCADSRIRRRRGTGVEPDRPRRYRDRGSGTRSADTDDGHRARVRARCGELHHLRLPDVSVHPLWLVGSAEGGGDWRAYRALVGLLPLQASAFDAARAASLAAHGLTTAIRAWHSGSCCRGDPAWRAVDGSAQAQFPYTAPGAGNPGVWVSVGGAPPVLPGWRHVTPWVVGSLSPFLPDGPPLLHSRRYARDYNEVKEIGSLTSLTRTNEQTEIARFWLAPPTVIWNGVARHLIQTHGLDLSAAARAFGPDVSRVRRCQHRVLGGQVHLQLLAPHHCDPERRCRRQRPYRGRSRLDAAVSDAAAS